MMKTVRFGEYDSWEDFGLVRTSTTIDKPAAKTSTVEVEGMDGVLDFTEYFGEVLYDNRTISLDFETQRPMEEFPQLFSDVCNAIDGKMLRIVLSEDPDFYYVGRVSVSEWKSNGRIGKLSIEADCEPYKYRSTITTKTVQVSGSKTESFDNLRKRVRPTFDLSASMTIRQGTKSFSASGNGWSDAGLYFGQGANELTFEGTGTVTVKYQEKGL